MTKRPRTRQSLSSFNEPDIYCGIIGVVTVETSKVILEEAENLSYEDGGIAKLIEMADGGLQVFHVSFTNLNQGWHGSVTKGRPDFHIPGVQVGSLFRSNEPHDSKWLQSENPSDFDRLVGRTAASSSTG